MRNARFSENVMFGLVFVLEWGMDIFFRVLRGLKEKVYVKIMGKFYFVVFYRVLFIVIIYYYRYGYNY